MRDILARLGWTALAFVLLEGLAFRTSLYPSLVEPDSTTGFYETQLGNELRRVKTGPQVLAVGHSRMGLLPRIANQSPDAGGLTYGTIALGGTTPRVWYYGLRTVDPHADRYAAIWIPVDDYNEPDGFDRQADRETDLHYIIRRVGIADLAEYTLSHESWTARWAAFRGLLLKSFVYRRDFQAFLANPPERIRKVRYYERESAGWYYGFEGETFSLAGMRVDWDRQEVEFPPAVKPDEQQMIRGVLFEKRPPRTGAETRYFTHWYGKIAGHYRNSATRLIFFRVPRGPVVRKPDPPGIPDTAVRRIAALPHVIVLPEHTFDDLERPELFGDALHLNRAGLQEFSRKVARMTPELLRGRS